MRWWITENDGLPVSGHNGYDCPQCLCEFDIDESSFLYHDLIERFAMLYWNGNDMRFEDGCEFYYEPDEIKRWCYLDEAISKLDE